LGLFLFVTATRVEAIFDWLCPSNIIPEEEQDAKSRLRTKGTAMWVLDNEVYREWKTPPSDYPEFGKLLWLQGPSNIPQICGTNFDLVGSGKSTIV
jgi:hypothetical protein